MAQALARAPRTDAAAAADKGYPADAPGCVGWAGMADTTPQARIGYDALKRGKGRPPSPERDLLPQLRAQGLSLRACAKRLGYHENTVRKWNPQLKCPRGVDPRMTHAVEMVSAGSSYREASDAIGVPRETIRTWCVKAGVRSTAVAGRPAKDGRPRKRRARHDWGTGLRAMSDAELDALEAQVAADRAVQSGHGNRETDRTRPAAHGLPHVAGVVSEQDGGHGLV